MPRLAYRPARLLDSRGFSLIELVLVIVVLGALATVGADLLRQPFDASAALQRRARMADEADQAMARMSRDIRLALPNSIRVSGDGQAIDLLLAPSGGRYRAQTGAGGSDVLNFTAGDNSFDVLGALTLAPKAGQYVVVYNLASSGSTANAWSGDNRANAAASTTTQVQFFAPPPAAAGSPFRFPYASPQQRFFIVDGAVMYRCAADGALRRYAGYTLSAAQPSPPTDGSSSLLTEGVGSCAFRYDAGASSRHALVSIAFALTRNGESTSLLKTVHVANTP